MHRGLFLKTFVQVRWQEKWRQRKKLEAHQQAEWAKKKAYFEAHVPYFIQHGLPEGFRMDKSFMMEHFDRLNTVGITKKTAFDVALSSEQSRDFSTRLGNISVGLSSGTSGNQGIFLTSEREQTIWAATILAKLLPKNHLWGNRLAFFLRSDNNLYQAVQSPILRLTYFDMELAVKEHIERLNQLQPHLLVAPASVLLQLARYQEKGVLAISPIKVVSVAEVLEGQDRKRIAQAFSQEIIHQIYQATEGFLGYTCEEGRLHLNEDGIIIEKEWIDEKRFHPIITDFKRESQAFVGYRLNDLLQVGESSCPCGSCLQVIEKIEGRSDDIFYARNQSGAMVSLYPDFIRRCFLQIEDLKEYQVRQVDIGRLVVAIEPVECQDELRQTFLQLAEDFAIEAYDIQFEPYFPPIGEKLRRVRQEMTKERIKEHEKISN